MTTSDPKGKLGDPSKKPGRRSRIQEPAPAFFESMHSAEDYDSERQKRYKDRAGIVAAVLAKKKSAASP